MAGIIEGQWSNDHHVPDNIADQLRHWVSVDGCVGSGGFVAEPGRYHFYLAYGCPSCHRVLIAIQLLGFSKYFSVSYVEDIKRLNGWEIAPGNDPIFFANSLHAVMIQAEGDLTAPSTVPLLVDKKNRRVVSNNSTDMVKMMANLQASLASADNMLWPHELVGTINRLNALISMSINSGVYRVLFETNVGKKTVEVEHVKEGLTWLDELLGKNRFLTGDTMTASDLWLFPTLFRFDSIYSEIFGLDFKLDNFKHLGNYLQCLWSIPEFSSVSQLDRIEDHYYRSCIHGPNGVVEPGRGRVVRPESRFALR